MVVVSGDLKQALLKTILWQKKNQEKAKPWR